MKRTLKIIFLVWLGAVLTGLAMPVAYAHRGYSAIGGEFTLVLLPLLVANIADTVKEMFGIKEKSLMCGAHKTLDK